MVFEAAGTDFEPGINLHSQNLRRSDMNKSPISLFLITLASFASLAMAAAPDSSPLAPEPETRTMTIQEVVRMAMSRSPEVLLAEAQAARAREAVNETRSLNRPQVYAGSGLAWNNGYPLSMEGAAPSIINVTASQSLFSKKNSNLIREAQESGKASRFSAASAREEVALRTALTYFQLHQAHSLIELASGRVKSTLVSKEQVDTLYTAGRALQADTSAAQTATLGARQQLLEAQEQANLAEIELRELTGLPETVSIKTVEPPIENPIFGLKAETLFRQALESAPEILQAEATVKAKELHVEAERGDSLPQIEAIGQYAIFSKTNHYEDYFNRFSRNNYLVGLSFRMPLFDGFRTRSRVAQSRQEVSEAKNRVDALKLSLKMTIERCLSALRVARGRAEVARNDLDATREKVRVNEVLLEAGRINPQQMEEVRSLLHQKEMALLETSQVLFQRKLDLLRAMGSISNALQ
jgi:outer membrane protein